MAFLSVRRSDFSCLTLAIESGAGVALPFRVDDPLANTIYRGPA